ncbi:MAG: hypothetical protein AKCLJLPJ_02129 [Fimbriimonadales bacterium]|nr:MAG: hypothetical protein EDM73_06375 [Armatimonadota bacterium]MBV6504034.1 hypothetical protein [Fimbriimonadales bacterium]MCE7899975.1 hypothetical protein [Armatimonadetes bacterium ATM1]MBC6968846.1 hypothetical protein [Armatimonadota bacterium]MBL1150462.1 hypothetical protein [Armatimonadota bacterium]
MAGSDWQQLFDMKGWVKDGTLIKPDQKVVVLFRGEAEEDLRHATEVTDTFLVFDHTVHGYLAYHRWDDIVGVRESRRSAAE